MIAKKKAFSLIELLITLCILAIALTPIFSLFIKSSNDLRLETKYIQAVFLAQKVMEELKYGLLIHPKIEISAPKFEGKYKDFFCQVTKRRIGDELFKLNVTVSFKYGILKKSVSFESLYSSRYPLKIYYRKDEVWQ